MLRYLAGFIAGAMSCLVWPQLPSFLLLGGCCVFALVCYRYGRFVSAAFLLGILWVGSVGQWLGQWQLPKSHISHKIQVVGEISSLIDLDPRDQGVRFNLRLQSIGQQPLQGVKPHIRLAWYHPVLQLQQGFQIKAWVKLKPVHGFANQGGFDYQKWLLGQGISATGYVLNQPVEVLATTISVRQQFYQRLQQLIDDYPNRAFINALLLGERSGLTAQHWEMLQQTGTSHLIAISGLHLSLLGLMALLFYRWMLAACCYLVPVKQVNRIWLELALSLVTLLSYAYLSGFSLPTIRASLLACMVVLLAVLGQRYSRLTMLLVCVASVLFIAPMSLLGDSFFLSFSAVAWILFLMWRFSWKAELWVNKLYFFVLFQLLLSLLMIPVSGYFFHQISWVTPLANMLAVPLVAFVILPLSLIAGICIAIAPHLATQLFSVVDWLFHLLVNWLTWNQALPIKPFNLPDIPLLAWLLLMLALSINLLPISWKHRLLSACLFAPWLSYLVPSQNPNWRLHVLDVGQGLSVVIQKKNRAIVYDVGAQYPSGFNTADAVLLPFMRYHGIQGIDHLILSHSDNDHAGSVAQLLRGVPVKQLIANFTVKGRKTRTCVQGLAFEWQGLKLEVIHPSGESDGNDGSCVMVISDGQYKVLLPGDISDNVERKLLPILADRAPFDVLIAPHHGSSTSSSDEFVSTVSAEHTVFSTGFYNRWQFPRADVEKRYQQHHVSLYNTAVDGQVSFYFTQPLRVKRYRHSVSPWFRKEQMRGRFVFTRDRD